jgi:hypothetical protein
MTRVKRNLGFRRFVVRQILIDFSSSASYLGVLIQCASKEREIEAIARQRSQAPDRYLLDTSLLGLMAPPIFSCICLCCGGLTLYPSLVY